MSDAEKFADLGISGVSGRAQRLLDRGKPVYYTDPELPGGLVKEYPDGRRELVIRCDGREVVLRGL
jgi:hypothetical protein